MNPQTELLELIAAAVKENCGITEVYLDNPPAGEGMYAEPGNGYTETLYYDKSGIRILPVVFLRRGSDQQTCLNELSVLCNYLENLKIYPQAQTFQWLDAAVAVQPKRSDKQESELVSYTCTLNCKVFY